MRYPMAVMNEKVKNVLSVLTFSEEEVLHKVIEALSETRATVVTSSRLTDNGRITRSVVLSLFRLLAAAGIIRFRSAGAKGTRVGVVDTEAWQSLREALARRR
ncbi:hypothetical protein [Caldinitratiruptor microaerophilus]|uniref:hypothetical protein n=1 Tax=Caldinitratiruptor microaerophilus TaxID=671077 RepID=UPI002230B247|nr:hypothetical protein [Caldinitratiruptor microaerophilus]